MEIEFSFVIIFVMLFLHAILHNRHVGRINELKEEVRKLQEHLDKEGEKK